MPLGIDVPRALVLPTFIGSAPPPNMAELPTSLAWKLAPDVSEAAFTAYGIPTPATTARVGVDAPVHDLAWFERIHVVPREVDLGPVGSKTQVLVEVWNAFRTRAKILQGITIDGATGVTIASPPTFPSVFFATESRLFSVEVSDEGTPIIDAVVTWFFVGIPSAGTDVHLIGFRAIPFAFDPNMETPVVERLGYLTDLLVSTKGMEQRIQLREVPIGSISYSVLFHDLREAQMANALLHGNQGRPFGIPRWQFRTVLTSPAVVDDIEIFCDPQDLAFEPGGLLILWASPFSWEARVIDQVLSDRITLSLGIQSPWPTGTPVLPLLLGRSAGDPAFDWPGLDVGSQDLVFEVEGFRP